MCFAPTDIEATRLACSVLNAACTALWNDGVIGKYQGDMEICYSLAKFLPAISRTFIKYNKFTRGNGSFKRNVCSLNCSHQRILSLNFY